MSRTTGAKTLVAVGILVAILAVVAVVLLLRSPDREDLLIVGDSVSYMSAGQIIGRLSDRNDLHFIAIPGDTTRQALDRLDEAIDANKGSVTDRDRVGVLIGYNDLFNGTVDTDALPELVERSSRFRCGVWLTLPGPPKGMETNPDIAADDVVRWNERLAAELEPYGNLHLADDWRTAVEDSSGEALLSDDGVHPNEAGEKALAKAYAAALDRAC